MSMDSSTEYTNNDNDTENSITNTIDVKSCSSFCSPLNRNKSILVQTIKEKQKLHYLSSLYYYKYHRIFHISHLFLNLLIFIILGNDTTSNRVIALSYIGLGLQGLNTFWTQVEALFGFSKYAKLHDKLSTEFRSLIAQVEFGDFDFEMVAKQYNLLELNAPDFPKRIAENLIDVDKYIE